MRPIRAEHEDLLLLLSLGSAVAGVQDSRVDNSDQISSEIQYSSNMFLYARGLEDKAYLFAQTTIEKLED